MAIVNAKCPDCHQIIKVDSLRDRSICNNCGHSFSVDQAINEFYVYKDKNKNNALMQTNNNNLEKKIKRAEMFLTIQQTNRARNIYRVIIHQYPRHFEGWFGLLLVKTNHFTRLYLTKNELKKCEKYFKKIKKYAPKEQLEIIQSKYEKYLKRQKKDNHLTKLRFYAWSMSLIGVGLVILMLILTAYIFYRLITDSMKPRIYMTIAYIYFAAFIGISFGLAINFKKRAKLYESRL